MKESNMDYTKLTKSELIEKLEEQKHLASAVQAKDKEMSDLKKLHEEQMKRLKEDKSELVTKYKGSLTKEQVDNITKKLIEERNDAFAKANLYIKIHHDLLKQMQHTAEMALFSEQLVSEKFKMRGEK
jgi:hypothetical protein